MRVGLSWLREFVDLPADVTADALDTVLNNLGIEVESITDQGASVLGSLVVGRVLTIEELTGFKKPIRFTTVDVGSANGTGAPQEIVCGARNFVVGDLVVVILPGGTLPGGFHIGARKTYGHNSHGMICSAAELGLGDDHSGIIVLDPASGANPGEDARARVGVADIIIDVEPTPDRGYQLSVRGLARELAHGFGRPFTDPGRPFTDPGRPGAARTGSGSRGEKGRSTPVAWPVTVVDQAGCDRFAVRLIEGIHPSAPSPEWMRQRLVTAGIRALGLAIDITNYVMLELGQPMHAFDADRVEGALVVRRATDGESLTTLDGVRRVLSTEDMVICDDRGPISLAAVMGGQVSEVEPATTTRVLFEAAHWDPAMVGRTARRHRLLSEAAKRWERGVDRELCRVAIDRATQLAIELGGPGVAASPDVLDLDYPIGRPTITMAADRPARLVGVSYPTERVVELLTAVGCAVAVAKNGHGDGGADQLTVEPPSWRPDLLGPADLTEEVVRLDGMENVPSTLPVAPPGNGLTAAQRRRRSVGRTLAERGYVEVLSHPFVSPEALAALGLDEPAVRLANPISAEEPLMRPSLLPPLLATLRRNVGRGHRDVALFEQGLVFRPADAPAPPAMGVDGPPGPAEWAQANAALPHQPWQVAVVVAGELDRAGAWGPGRPADWADAVQAARDVLSAAGVAERDVSVANAALGSTRGPWHPGRCAQVRVGGTVVGHAGELHPQACADLDLPRRTVAMELDLDAVPLPGPTPAPVISTFPPAIIDVALVVEADTSAGTVEAALRAGAGALLESVRLFDIYTGDPVPAGRKSLAYKLILRAADRTLTAEEAVAVRDAAVHRAETLGATLRGA